MEQEDTELTAQEREAAARPTDAGDYWTSWNAFRTAQRLFSEDVAQVDADSRDKKNKKAFGARTVAVRDWFNNLPKSKMDEAERVAKKWNEEGTPSKDKMNMYLSFRLKFIFLMYLMLLEVIARKTFVIVLWNSLRLFIVPWGFIVWCWQPMRGQMGSSPCSKSSIS